MSTLTDKITEALEKHTHQASASAVHGRGVDHTLLGRHCCECGAILPRVPRGPAMAAAIRRHHAEVVAAVVAEWLVTDEVVEAVRRPQETAPSKRCALRYGASPRSCGLSCDRICRPSLLKP